MRSIIVGITGASGSIYGVRTLELLAPLPDVETHLVISPPGRVTLSAETDLTVDDLEALADHHHSYKDISVSVASGSFPTDGMIVAPCSIKSLSSIANAYGADLLTRAADVTLKERRPLVLLVRETPLHVGHLRLMQQVAEIGAVVFPPVPAFYPRPESLDDIVNHTVGRALEHVGIGVEGVKRWQGLPRD